MNWKLQCFPFHTWNLWKDVEVGEIIKHTFVSVETIDRTIVAGAYKRQERTCKVCGKLQLRTERSGI